MACSYLTSAKTSVARLWSDRRQNLRRPFNRQRKTTDNKKIRSKCSLPAIRFHFLDRPLLDKSSESLNLNGSPLFHRFHLIASSSCRTAQSKRRSCRCRSPPQGGGVARATLASCVHTRAYSGPAPDWSATTTPPKGAFSLSSL